MDELVKALRNNADHYGFVGENGLAHLLTNAADAIEELSAAVEGYESSTNMALVEKDGETVIEFQPKWIPVTERLPEEKHAVIVWEPKYLNPYICVLSEGDWYVFGGYGVKVFGVTHWMPLPEPPKEET